MFHQRFLLLTSLLLAGLLLSIITAVAFGSARIPLETVVNIISYKLSGNPISELSWNAGHEHIVWFLRLPRVLLGGLVGAGLALVGTSLQAVTRNPLADPHLLGVTSGASLGAVIVLLFVGEIIGVFTLPVAAFLGALVSISLVLSLANQRRQLSSERLLLAGVAVSFVLMAGANMLLFLGDHRAAPSVVFWMLGGLGAARWEMLFLPALCIIIGFILLFSLSRALNALIAGDITATTLGIEPGKVRLLVFIIASLITGVLVAFSGSIGFVGLMIPHIARFFIGAEHRRLLPIAALSGAIFLIWTDVFARVFIAPQDLPIGIVTAALGGVSFMIILRRRQ